MTKLEIINKQVECLSRQLASYTKKHRSSHWTWVYSKPDEQGENYLDMWNPELCRIEKISVRELYWWITYLVVPEGAAIKPRCEVKFCVNPDHQDVHYFLGDNKHYQKPNDDSDWGIPNGWSV